MTREEAIELFKDVEVLVFRDVKQKYFHEDIEEAFKLAIEALEQEDINSVLEDVKAEIKEMVAIEALEQEDINSVLEDVKAEIKEMVTFENVDDLVNVTRIIDKHRRGEK